MHTLPFLKSQSIKDQFLRRYYYGWLDCSNSCILRDNFLIQGFYWNFKIIKNINLLIFIEKLSFKNGFGFIIIYNNWFVHFMSSYSWFLNKWLKLIDTRIFNFISNYISSSTKFIYSFFNLCYYNSNVDRKIIFIFDSSINYILFFLHIINIFLSFVLIFRKFQLIGKFFDCI